MATHEGHSTVVPRSGVEPERPCGHRFLRPTRLPVPPPRRGRNGARQYHWPMRTAGALALWLVLASCALGGAAPAITPVAGTTSTPSQAASKPRITPPAVTPPSPPGTNLPVFKCADIAGGTLGTAKVTGVRVSEQPGAGY